jgi:hypothetical protein
MTWSIEYEGEAFDRFVFALPEYERTVLTAALDHVLTVHGIDVCSGDWGQAAREGLDEFRIMRSLNAILTLAGLDAATIHGADRSVLLRVFCTFHGDRIVLLYHGYDKLRDPTPKRQQKEIAKARKLHEEWKRRH